MEEGSSRKDRDGGMQWRKMDPRENRIHNYSNQNYGLPTGLGLIELIRSGIILRGVLVTDGVTR